MNVYRTTALGLALLVGTAYYAVVFAEQRHPTKSHSAMASPQPQQVEHGRYLVKITGCNDCHTPGYAAANGNIPEQHWLTGDTLGYRGPWGTTYPINLRLYMQNLSETQWVQVAQNIQTRPPMPWFALRDMTPADLRAIYHFIRSLGPAGEPAPAYLPPEQVPTPPYVLFQGPVNMVGD